MSSVGGAVWLLMVAASLAGGCATTCSIDVVDSGSAVAVSTVVRRLVAADNARDLDLVLSCYADDVVWLPPGEDVVEGKTAIRARYERLFADFAVAMSIDVDEATADGELGFARGSTHGAITPVDGGAPIAVDDRFVALLRREHGAWRVTHLMWTPRDDGRHP